MWSPGRTEQEPFTKESTQRESPKFSSEEQIQLPARWRAGGSHGAPTTCQGKDKAVETPGGAGGGKAQALNLREPARVSGSGSGSVVCTQQTGLQGPPGDHPRLEGKRPPRGSRRQRQEDPSRGTTGQEKGSTSLTTMFHCILVTNTLTCLFKRALSI